MELDLAKVAEYSRRADTEELLDRVTAYRGDMEPAAVDLIENELDRRGVRRDAIDEHARKQAAWITGSDGKVLRCAFCESPAVVLNWGWFRAWGRIPIFPKKIPRCGLHAEGKLVEKAELEAGH